MYRLIDDVENLIVMILVLIFGFGLHFTKSKIRIILGLSSSAIVIGINILFFPRSYIFSLFYIFFILFLMPLLFDEGFLSKFSCTVSSVLFTSSIDAITSHIVMAFSNIVELSALRIGEMALSYTLSFLVYLIIYFSMLKPHSVSIYEFGKSYSLILSVQSLVLMLVIDIIWDYVFKADTASLITYLFFIFVLILMLSEVVGSFSLGMKNVKLKRQNVEIQRLLQIQLEQYDYQKDRENNVRKARHDIKNHIAVVQNFLSEGKYDNAKSYLNELLSDFENKTSEIRVGHDLLDALLNFYHHLCAENGISLNVHGVISDKPDINNVDLCTIIGNILRNACEAAAFCSEKSIDFSIRQVADRILIEETNSYSGTLNIKDGKLLSTKDQDFHSGLGLSNIRDSIYKNNGSVQISTKTENGINYFSIICAFNIKKI